MTERSMQQGAMAQLSDGLAEAVERAAASTVLVDARSRIPASGIVWSGEGVIVTADHVIERDEEIGIGLPEGGRVTATLAGRDPGSDIAVLRVEANGLQPADRAPAGGTKVGHLALAVGRPSQHGPMASIGIVSAVGGPWRTFRGVQIEGYLRTDATLYPGFSGGPLVNMAGAVLGMNSSRLGRGGIAIPPEAVDRVVADLLSHGRIRRGYLGIGSQPTRLPGALAEKAAGQETALLVMSVEPGSPAEVAGLMVGDLLVGLGSKPVKDTDDLQSLLGPDAVGQSMPLTVLRGGERKEITVVVGERPAPVRRG